MSGKTRNYTDEFKRQIVALVKSGKSSNSVVCNGAELHYIRSFDWKLDNLQYLLYTVKNRAAIFAALILLSFYHS